MIYTYGEAIDWIHGRLRLGIKPGLTRMEWMMEKLNHPEKKLKAVHIGGTNGKGSTVTYLRSIIQASGGSVGTFTSPYFETFNERIAVNGIPISDDEWLTLTQKIKPLADELEQSDLGGPTEFEVITAMMFLYFGEMRTVDVVLIEVGLGGRFDSTNIVQPICSIITSIGLDHVAILGSSYEEIAFEKAGIIKRHVPVVVNVKQKEAFEVIQQKAEEQQAPLFSYGQDFTTNVKETTDTGESFRYIDQKKEFAVEMSMTGQHQVENASLAIYTALKITDELTLSLTDQAIREGVKQAYWPGRMEQLSEEPLVIMDGAHNKEGIEALLDTINRKFINRDIHILFAAVDDKDLSSMIQMLDQRADSISFSTFDMPRAAKSETLLSYSHHSKKEMVDPVEWINKAFERNNRDAYIMTGSLYFLSSIRTKIMNLLNSKNNK